MELVLSCVDNFEARMAINRVGTSAPLLHSQYLNTCYNELLNSKRVDSSHCAGEQRAQAELARVGRQRERRLGTRAAPAARRDRLLRGNCSSQSLLNRLTSPFR